MSESVLNALIRLFALISDIHDDTVITGREKSVVESFLLRHLNTEMTARYMGLFNEFLGLYNSENIKKGSVQDRKRTSLNAMRILSICEKINEELRQDQKVYVLIQLMDYISLGDEISENELDFLQTVSSSFYIPENEYADLRNIIIDGASAEPASDNLLVINSNEDKSGETASHIYRESLEGQLLILHVGSTNTYALRYSGESDLYLNGRIIGNDETYIFEQGSSIRGSGIETIYYSEVVAYLTEQSIQGKIILEADNVSFRFRNSENGIHNLDFREESGRLVGILGGSGVGKSTTLSILNGMIKPQEGRILINGYNLYDENEKKKLEGVIGFVPQDDLLIEELTVCQNLYFSARLCMSNLGENEIVEEVKRILNDLDLHGIKDLKVGSPLNKVISGGQRKRLNIALELLREPTILFVDEPTSGLSSMDSEIVMNLLKDQAYKGKLVIVNIHQPSSDVYKMFDRIMVIDRGGYQIFYGNPSEAIVWFRAQSNFANPEEDQCIKCGTVNPDQILQIIEARVINEKGHPTAERKVTPKEWADRFRTGIVTGKSTSRSEKIPVPENKFCIPGLIKQSAIFFTRDLCSKLADIQFLLTALLGPPLLALLLSYFIRQSPGNSYIFSENENIHAYLFMCVITSLFFGLIISVKEIISDRKILQRESFLSLSWVSYLNSKVVILFFISAVQAISFVLIGNTILGIKGMTFAYWLVLFTSACFANLLGLIMSSAFRSLVAIYVLIPFILIPQLLFSGALVRFDRLHISRYASREYVPVIGEVMAARWAYEALAVKQFRDNRFTRITFKYDMDESQNDWYANHLVTALDYDLRESKDNIDNAGYERIINDNFRKLEYYIGLLSEKAGTEPGPWKNSLNRESFTVETFREAQKYLEDLKSKFKRIRNISIAAGDSVKEKIGNTELNRLAEEFENRQLRTIMLDELTTEKSLETNDRIIQKYQPAYMIGTFPFGRAQLYAPYKKLGNTEIDTFVFDLVVLWIGTLILYLLICFRLPERIVNYISTVRLKKSD